MSNAVAVRADYGLIIADPLFKAGYNEIWDGLEPAVDIRWSDAETEAYERGRQFGVVVKTQEGVRLPLTRGSLTSPRAQLLLMMAMRAGEVL